MTTNYVFFIELDDGIVHLSVHSSWAEAEAALRAYAGKLFSDRNLPVPADADLHDSLLEQCRAVDFRIFESADGSCDWYLPDWLRPRNEQAA